MRADRNLFIENCSPIKKKTTLVEKQFYTRGGEILSGLVRVKLNAFSWVKQSFLGQMDPTVSLGKEVRVFVRSINT